ncbi:MAG: hypothetical protein HZA88_11720 [Verrucomicrobia bacterium]|nr:hypothetical protein [Verrucomicrobiota bacterium]
MRLLPTIAFLLAAELICAAQMASPRPATVMFSNSGSFVVKVNREPWLRGQAGAATPGWKQSFVQTDSGTNVITKCADDRWSFAGTLGPKEPPDAAWFSYNQTLLAIGDLLQMSWKFRTARAMELELLHVSLALPARRFAGKTIRFDSVNLVLPEQPAPATQRPITGRPQRIIIDSGSLGSIAIRFDRPQVVWVEDRRQVGGDDFELRVLLATGVLKAGSEYDLALQIELTERPELLVGGNGREFVNDTRKWTRFDLQDAPKPPPPVEAEKRAPTDASGLLQAPAGKFGTLQTKGGHFVWPNGARQRFWGVHLSTASAPAQENAEVVAARIAQFGINLIRWTVSSFKPDAAEVDRFDRLVAELARRGVYSHLTLPTPRPSNPAVVAPLAGFVERSADNWLLHKNRHTGKRWVDDPSLALVQISSNSPMFEQSQPATTADHNPSVEFYSRTYKYLRMIGVKCPIITDDSPPATTNLTALISAGDAVGIGGAWDPLRPDGFIENKALASSDGGYLRQFASASVAHKPLLITHVSHPQANEYRAEAPLLLAAHAALQDWDGIIWDNYTNDPAVIGQFPVAARIFLGELASPSRLSTCVLRNDAASVRLPAWLTFTSRWRNALPNVAAPTPDIVIAADGKETPKDAPVKKPIRLVQKAGDDPFALQRHWVGAARKLRVPLGWEEGPQREFASDNGQLAWDQDHGQFTLLAPACRAAAGFIGGKTLNLADVTFDLGTPSFAVVSLTALDGSQINESRQLLLTTVARCENTEQRWFENLAGHLKMLSAKPGAQLEPVRATITLHRARAFKVFPLNPAGQRGPEMPASRIPDGFTFIVNGESMFYELVSEGGLRLWPFKK